MSKQLTLSLFVLALFFGIPTNSAFATFINLTERKDFQPYNPDGSGMRPPYDPAIYTNFYDTVFTPFTDGKIYSVDSFKGQAGDSLSMTMISEVAALDGDVLAGAVPGMANNFGVFDGQGNFISLLDSQNNRPGATAGLTLDGSTEYTLGLKSGLFEAPGNPRPGDYLFSAKDSDNADGLAHIVAMKVTTGGTLTIPASTLPSAANGGNPQPFTFNLLPGDIIIGVEDLLNTGSFTIGGLLPDTANFDYQDMLFVVRAQAVPEPTTLALLGAGLVGAALRRKKLPQ